MSKRNINLILFLCVFFMTLQSLFILATERSIYIGDIVTLEINGETISKEDVVNAFSEFEIVEISEVEAGYQVKIRTYETGNKIVTIGQQEVTIVVTSLLDEIEREDIYSGDLLPRQGEKYFNWLILYGVISICLVITGGIYLYKYRHKKEKNRTPHEQFLYAMGKINVKEDACLEEMTVIIKKYIEAIYSYKVIGKSTNELINELKDVVNNESCNEALMNWLMICDGYKFSGLEAKENEKINLKEELLAIGEMFYDIELQKNEAAKENNNMKGFGK